MVIDDGEVTFHEGYVTSKEGQRLRKAEAEGKHAEAIATYLKVYELSSASVVLLNIANIYDRKLHERELASDRDPAEMLLQRMTRRGERQVPPLVS